MTFDYGEACPISKATSVLCERWTLQIIREMLMGATRFTEFQKYLPKLSPTLLNSRLRLLEEEGIILKKKTAEKRSYEYRLTPAGMALAPVLAELGKWGMQWVFESMNEDELNVSTIVRDFAWAMDVSQLPSGNSTIQFSIEHQGVTSKKFVLVRDGKAQVCEENIGLDVDVYLSASLKTFYDIWFAATSLSFACDKGLLKLVGAPSYVRQISKWLRTSQFGDFRKSPGC
ncbi:MAG: helix-turn-helix transcriptional regulator [Gammaproteobacteria bacterium]|nr:helix-turn-helix transcriptional regulator [Gammaproteobacteria bacterium]